jgi:hypothetical protein
MSVFGKVDEEQAAVRALKRLEQRGPADTYTTDFMRLRSRLNWNEEALVAAYYTGLKDKIKDELARDKRLTTLRDIINKAVRINNRLWEQ